MWKHLEASLEVGWVGSNSWKLFGISRNYQKLSEKFLKIPKTFFSSPEAPNYRKLSEIIGIIENPVIWQNVTKRSNYRNYGDPNYRKLSEIIGIPFLENFKPFWIRPKFSEPGPAQARPSPSHPGQAQPNCAMLGTILGATTTTTITPRWTLATIHAL